MTLVPSVTELILAELLYLQYEDNNKPIYLYINSTGTSKEGQKYGYDTEARAIYDTIKYVNPPVHTVAVGTAWGEAAMLLASGEKGHRGAAQREHHDQAADQRVPRAGDGARRSNRNWRFNHADAGARRCCRRASERASRRSRRTSTRPKYFNPWEAVEYGIIDQVFDGKAK